MQQGGVSLGHTTSIAAAGHRLLTPTTFIARSLPSKNHHPWSNRELNKNGRPFKVTAGRSVDPGPRSIRNEQIASAFEGV